MTGFKIDPNALTGYAALLGRAADDVEQCRAYFNANVPEINPIDNGLINLLCLEHGNLRRRVAGVLDHLTTILESSETALKSAADQYRRSDVDAGARLDSSYPAVQRPNLRRE